MFTTTITGEDQIINRMQAFNKDVWKVLQQDVKSAADLIGASARSMVPGTPATGWSASGRLGWNASSVSSSIKPKFRSRQMGGRRYVMGTVDSNSAAGNLYSLAGSKTSTQFGDLMNAMWGPAKGTGRGPRLLAPAWTMHVDEARARIQQAVDDAARKVAL